MRLNEISYTGLLPIDGYGPGFFRIGGTVYEGAVVVSPLGVAGWAGLADAETVLKFVAEIDVVFVGTGEDIAVLPPDFRQRLETAGIGVEAMASAPACRTYNVLLSEGRRVAAALLPV